MPRESMYPNLFIVGAPKCGTTTLAGWLASHPYAFMSVPKEPHYFNTDLRNRGYTDVGDYLGLFRNARRDDAAVGEASTWYLFSRSAIPTIESSVGQPRYIVMTRDPVEMVQSLYLHNKRHLHEDAGSLEEAWRLEHKRREGAGIPRSCKEPAFLLYREVCSLGLQVERMLGYVPASRILHIDLGDMRDNPADEYKRALWFLGLPHDGREDFRAQNEGRGVRSRTMQTVLLRGGGGLRRVLGIRRGFGLVRLNESKTPREIVAPELAAEIRNELGEDRLLLKDAVRRLRAQ